MIVGFGFKILIFKKYICMSGVFGVRNQLMELVKAFDECLYDLNGSETSLIR